MWRVKREIMSNQELAKERNKTILRKFEKSKVHSSFIDNIWGANLADMQLISKFNKGIRFLLSVIDIYSKYVWVVLLKDEKGITITNAFQQILNELNRKQNKIWVIKSSEFHSRSMQSWLEDNDIDVYSEQNEGKFVVAERFIKVLQNIFFIKKIFNI